MIPNFLSAIWTATAPAMGNHLWQSTLCLIIAGLLTLVLRKNHARVRYGLWLAASVKFLIPFSLLNAIGSHLAGPRALAPTYPGFFSSMEAVSQPFTPPAAPVISPDVHSTPPNLVHLLPAILVAAWLCGFIVVLIVWYARSRRISAALREAQALREGREVEAQRRAESVGGIRKPVELLLSQSTQEPGIFGIVKPVLVWPKEISARLDDAQLEAILAHEAWHVRRRDNLAAAIHMVVEALFWFHPLVWWLGSRLVEERERACDEEVLQLGSDRQVYAESILKTCEFCVESPLACVSGVTSADLKKRIVRIMTERMADRLSFGRKLLLAGVGLVAVVGPITLGLLNAPQVRAQTAQTTDEPLPSFEVASIKPSHSAELMTRVEAPKGRFIATSITAEELIKWAYAGISLPLRDNQLSGGPSWISSERYDIDAKLDDSQTEALQKLPHEQRIMQIRLTVQSLLADRFKLVVKDETKELPVYVLVLAKNGPKLQEAKPGDTYPNGIKGLDGRSHPGMMWMENGQLTGQALPMASLVMILSHQLGRTILDQTGLKGKYDIALKWKPDQSSAGMFMGSADSKPGTDAAPPPDSSGPSIFTALQEQLGLKLESTTGPVEVIVIDHIERPSEN